MSPYDLLRDTLDPSEQTDDFLRAPPSFLDNIAVTEDGMDNGRRCNLLAAGFKKEEKNPRFFFVSHMSYLESTIGRSEMIGVASEVIAVTSQSVLIDVEEISVISIEEALFADDFDVDNSDFVFIVLSNSSFCVNFYKIVLQPLQLLI